MKILATTLLLVNIYSFSGAQTFSREVDSLTTTYLNQLSKNKAVKFDSILNQRKEIKLFDRIDTLPFDYAFIEEYVQYADTFVGATELYFSSGDKVARYAYYGGKPGTPPTGNVPEDLSKNVSDYFFKLSQFAHSYSKLKPIQMLPYDKLQVWIHGCVVAVDGLREFVEMTTRQLKLTYQIRTMIDKKNQKVIVSIQLPPKRPKFKVRSWNQAWF